MALEDFDAQEWVHDSPYGHLHLRDLFAAFVMAGIVASGKRVESPDDAANIAYVTADAMLAQRNKNDR